MDTNFAKTIKENGIVKIKNFLTPEEIRRCSEIVKFYKAPKGDKNSFFVTNIKVFFIKLLKLEINKLKHSYELLQLKKSKKLDEIAQNFFNKKTKLSFIDGYFSKIEKKDIIPWHTDQAYSGEKKVEVKFNNPDTFYLKFFIYLTKVSSNNGCMSYIPGSHKIGYQIRKAIYCNEISYQPYWSLRDFRKIITDNYNYFNNTLGTNTIEDFLVKTNFDETGQETSQFDYDAEAGTMVIFDEGGVHRGSKPTLNDRMVIRYLFDPILH